MKRDGVVQLLAGGAVLAWGVLSALTVSVVAYGGVWQAGLTERALWFGPSIAAFVAGLALMMIGARRLMRDRASL